nr:hypothetical protein [Nesterenkonia muleiensis]
MAEIDDLEMVRVRDLWTSYIFEVFPTVLQISNSVVSEMKLRCHSELPLCHPTSRSPRLLHGLVEVLKSAAPRGMTLWKLVELYDAFLDVLFQGSRHVSMVPLDTQLPIQTLVDGIVDVRIDTSLHTTL